MSLEERRKGFELGMAYGAGPFTRATLRAWTAEERAVINRFFEAAAEEVEKTPMPPEVADDEPARAAPAYGGPPPPPEQTAYSRGVTDTLDALRMEAEAVRLVEHPLRMKAIDAYHARVKERAEVLCEVNPFRGRR